MTWLVTGGAGYIGAHVVAAMTAAGEQVVALDDLSSGDPSRVTGAPLVVASIGDDLVVRETIRTHGITGVVHLAGKKSVPESMADPLRYYRENIEGLRSLMSAASGAGVQNFVFSSSAAVYGSPDVDLVTEATPCQPVNPYGESKLVGEWLLAAVGRATELPHVSLRYFNVAGAARPELADTTVANLMTQVFARLEAGQAPQVFGTDHATPDGTCIRDFVHAADIAEAHVAAARALSEGRIREGALNIGRGVGVSVREMCQLILDVAVEDLDGVLPPEFVGARAGDPARVVASARRAEALLGWRATRGAEEMVRSAWAGWRRRVAATPLSA